MVAFLMSGLFLWLAAQIVDLLGQLQEWFTIGVFSSPDVTVLPQVRAMAGKSALVVNACYVLAIITAAIMVMVGGSVEVRYEVKDLVPRLVVGAVMSNMALPICATLTDVANALVASMVGTTRAPVHVVIDMARGHLNAAIREGKVAVLALVVCLLIAALLVMFLFSYLVRVAVLVILAGIAPLALACYCLPFTQPAAALWWRTLLGTLGTAVLQGITFSTGLQLLVDPNSSLPVLIGLPHLDVLNLLLVVVVLWTTVKIPGLMRKYVTQKGGINLAALIMRTVVIQSATRRMPFMRGRS